MSNLPITKQRMQANTQQSKFNKTKQIHEEKATKEKQ